MLTNPQDRSPNTRMRAIFISYRRDDAEGHAGRLFEDLAEHFGKASVFMDVTGIEPGRDFRHVIEQQVGSCGVLLAVIGKSWLTATDAEGRRRLDDPYDFVRLETVAALKRDIPVVPVLVHGARMPRSEQLPDVLANLAFRNSVELTHARWSSDVQLLIGALLPYVDAVSQPARQEPSASPGVAAQSDPASPSGAAAARPANHAAQAEQEAAKKWPLLALTAVLAIAAAWVGYLVSDRPHTANPPQTSATPASAGKAVPTRTDEQRVAAGVANDQAAPVLPTPSAEAVPVNKPIATRDSTEESLSARKAAIPALTTAATKAAAEHSAVPHAGVKRPTAPKREPVATAQRPAADKVGAEPVVRTAPEVVKNAETRPESIPPFAISTAVPNAMAPPVPNAMVLPVPNAMAPPARAYAPAPVVVPPVAPPKAEGEAVTAAKVAPNRGNTGIALLGDAASPASATRTIAIYPDTRYVNVTGGEIVKFTVGNQSFAWNFNGRPSSFDLNAVAPPGVLDHGVQAYVAPNPLYINPRR